MLQTILLIVYVVAGWWAVNKVWFSRHTYIVGDSAKFYTVKFAVALFFGWILIPIAIVMTVLGK